MSIVLPNLDDRRWQDLADEGRSLIPLYSPEWTNFNPSDPGITLLELFALIAEMDIYQINRIPDRHKWKFLELIGLQLAGPQPARTVLSFALPTGALPVFVPEGQEYKFGPTSLVFRTLQSTTVAPGAMTFAVSGDALTLSFTDPLPPSKSIGLYLQAGPGQRTSLDLIWEYRNSQGWWSPLDTADHTCGFAHDGLVWVIGPGSMGKPYSIRARTSSSETPVISSLTFNGIAAEQAQLVNAITVATGTGAPGQRVILPHAPIVEASLSLAGSGPWTPRTSLDASTPADAHFVLDAQTGTIFFGDGRRGRVPTLGETLIANYHATEAAHGELAAAETATGTGSLLVQNARVAVAGKDAETLPEAIARAAAERESRLRAVTLKDFESLARATPGVNLARVTALANMYPGLDCVKAFGVITVIVMPNTPGPTPRPSVALCEKIRAFLNRRRMIGTRVEVVGPIYFEVAVKATVKGFNGQNPTRLRDAVADALNTFFDPLTGGADGNGWPFGRDVYRMEVMQIIAGVPGVDHVLTMDLLPAGCQPQCGNICLKPTWLVTPGRHQIEVS